MKGLVYVTYLAPTFINIITIYSVSNIHDVTWGSRPAGDSEADVNKRAKDMSIDYRDYRSKFLIIWLIFNAIAGGCVVIISRSNNYWYLFIFAVILMVMISSKILFSTLYIFTS